MPPEAVGAPTSGGLRSCGCLVEADRLTLTAVREAMRERLDAPALPVRLVPELVGLVSGYARGKGARAQLLGGLRHDLGSATARQAAATTWRARPLAPGFTSGGKT